MNGVKYVVDNEKPMSEGKHKSPWITVNGRDVADSQFAIDFLRDEIGLGKPQKLSERSAKNILKQQCFQACSILD